LKLLVPHQEIDAFEARAEAYKIIEAEKIPFILYPRKILPG